MRANVDLTPKEMLRRVRRARRFEESRAYEVASYLRVIDERRYFTSYGHSSVVAFAAAELDMSGRQVRERIRVARALDPLPRLREAFRRGKVSFCAAREITRVATPATEADWVMAAAHNSVHELERLVSASKDGDVPDRNAVPGERWEQRNETWMGRR